MDTARTSPTKGLWPIWAAMGMPLLLIGLNSTPIAPNFAFVMIGIPALLCIWACLGVWALVISIRRMRNRQWSQAIASAVLPLVILFAGLRFWDFIHLCNYGGDVVNFMAKRSSFIQEIRATPPDGKPRLQVFNRGGMIWASRGFVYDESDEVVLAGFSPISQLEGSGEPNGTQLRLRRRTVSGTLLVHTALVYCFIQLLRAELIQRLAQSWWCRWTVQLGQGCLLIPYRGTSKFW